MKEQKLRKRIYARLARERLKDRYNEKYFNIWLNSWKWNGISREQREYIMRRFWESGKVCCFKIVDADLSFMEGVAPAKEDSGDLGFAGYSIEGYNMWNFPTRILPINERGVPYIPDRQLQVGTEAVLGWAQHSRKGIREMVDSYIEQIVSIEMTIRTNLTAQKLPVVIEVTPKAQSHAEELMSNIYNDEDIFFINTRETDSVKGISTGIPYNIDKLYAYKNAVENELLTFLGVDNIGNVEKKERLITDEANANNDIINDHSDAIGSCLQEFCDEIKKVFGYTITIEATSSPAQAMEEQADEMGEENEESEEKEDEND